VAAAQQLSDKFAPFANFMIANSAGAVVWVLFYGLGAYYLGKGVEEFARPFAMALAVLGAIVVVSMTDVLSACDSRISAAIDRLFSPRSNRETWPLLRPDNSATSPSVIFRHMRCDLACGP
jgi:hypothetical protein